MARRLRVLSVPIARLERIMSKKNHRPGPVPAGNQPKTGPAFEEPEQDEPGKTAGPQGEVGPQEEDPKHRMGNFTGKAEHARQQPGPKNDGGKPHSENG
jgi:hypothetical protein